MRGILRGILRGDPKGILRVCSLDGDYVHVNLLVMVQLTGQL